MRYLPLLVLSSSCLSACGTNRAATVLDDRTGTTLVRGPEPIVFARSEPRYSRSGRDYIYLGPVQTNRQGVREYYLWVGVATTLDRGYLAPQANTPQTLILDLRGEPIELKLRPWREVVEPGRRRLAYRASVPLAEELGARVTLQQLTLLDAAGLQSLRIDSGAGGAPAAYVRWDKGGNFADFLSAVGPAAQQ
jgi:hypothetical protein